MDSLAEAAGLILAFENGSLTRRLAELEGRLRGTKAVNLASCLPDLGITPALWVAGTTLKKAAGQINVLLHAVGVLLILPRVLQPGEAILSLSLGAGNTGRAFDLETDQQIAEFSFIDWKGGSESIRQNAVFGDFFRLAEADTPKARYLYVKGSEHPLRFLHGGRRLVSVTSRNASLRSRLDKLYSDRFGTVRDYFDYRKDRVHVVDIRSLLPAFPSGSAQDD